MMQGDSSNFKKGKLIIFSAPSGSGKSTIVNFLLQKDFKMKFSISATSRAPRGEEKDGVEYYFLSTEDFRSRIDKADFLEWEEVYKDTYYGTLKSEVERITSEGNNIVFDIDVVGGVNLKKMYGKDALSIFVQAPSLQELEKRLISRSTDSSEVIKMRLDKAAEELTYASQFDKVILNDDLSTAQKQAEEVLRDFLND